MATEQEFIVWKHWPINWSAIAVGVLTALALGVVFSLIGLALGAYHLSPDYRVVDVKKIHWATMVLGVCGAFFAFVVAGWAAGKIAGILYSETAMLYGAIVWLAVIPLLALFSTLGVAGYAGSWYAGLNNATWAVQAPYVLDRPSLSLAPTDNERARYDAAFAEYQRKVERWNAETPVATRNAALLALTALVVSLLGSVLGGWMASGEPMSWRYDRSVHAVARG